MSRLLTRSPAARGGRNPNHTYAISLTADDSNQRDSFMNQLAAIPDGTTGRPVNIHLPAGDYRVDEGIRVLDRSHLRISGPAAGTPYVQYTDLDSDDLDIPFEGVPAQFHFALDGCTDVVVSHVNIEGPNDERDATNPDYARFVSGKHADHGLAIRDGCHQCGFTDCTVTQVYGDGIYVGSGVDDNCTDCFVRRVTGSYAGRQGMAVTHVERFEAEDIEMDWGGRSGLDVEPIHASSYVEDATFTRCSFGSQFFPFSMTGSIAAASTGAVQPKKIDISLIDCSVIRCASAHSGILNDQAGCGGTLLIDGFTDLRGVGLDYGLTLGGGIDSVGNDLAWPDIIVRNCTVRAGVKAGTTYALRVRALDSLTVEDNDFTGTTEGFDELVSFGREPTVYTHSGNVWNAGASTD